MLVLTDQFLTVLNAPAFTVKEVIPLADIVGVSMSRLSDDYFIIHTVNSKKGDTLYRSPNLIEFAVTLLQVIRKLDRRTIRISCEDNSQLKTGNRIMDVAFRKGLANEPVTVKKTGSLNLLISTP